MSPRGLIRAKTVCFAPCCFSGKMKRLGSYLATEGCELMARLMLSPPSVASAPAAAPAAAAALLELALPPANTSSTALDLGDGAVAPSEPPVGACQSLAYLRDRAHAAFAGTCGERASEAGKVRCHTFGLGPDHR